MATVLLQVDGPRKAHYRCPVCNRKQSYQGTFLPPAQRTCRGCRTVIHFSSTEELIDAAENVGTNFSFDVTWAAERVEVYRRKALEEFGIDFDTEPDTMLNLAALDLTRSAWRNSPLEDIHAGEYGGGIPDKDMMRHNIDTYRLVRKHLRRDAVVTPELVVELTVPGRIMPTGQTLSDLAGPGYTDLVRHMLESLTGLQEYEINEGADCVLYHMGFRGGVNSTDWYGTPWWADIVDVFIERLLIPESSAWRYDDCPSQQVPVEPETLRVALKKVPERLSGNRISWCLQHGLGFESSQLGRARWRLRRGLDAPFATDLAAHDAALEDALRRPGAVAPVP